MSKIQISRYELNRLGNKRCDQVGASHSSTVIEVDPPSRRTRMYTKNRSRFALQGLWQLTAPASLCASLIGLTGCATHAELESLRAEVAKANAIAARAEAHVSKTQRELAAFKAVSEPPQAISEPRTPTPATTPATKGYKWGKVHPD